MKNNGEIQRRNDIIPKKKDENQNEDYSELFRKEIDLYHLQVLLEGAKHGFKTHDGISMQQIAKEIGVVTNTATARAKSLKSYEITDHSTAVDLFKLFPCHCLIFLKYPTPQAYSKKDRTEITKEIIEYVHTLEDRKVYISRGFNITGWPWDLVLEVHAFDHSEIASMVVDDIYHKFNISETQTSQIFNYELTPTVDLIQQLITDLTKRRPRDNSYLENT